MIRDGIDPARRALLRGRSRVEPAPLRPPWARRDGFTDACTRCGLCIGACPDGLLVRGDGGFPRIDFTLGECTFCRACVDACPEPAFDRSGTPWDIVAAIGPKCLARQGVVCRSCRDACPAAAISFTLEPGGIAIPNLDPRACTGCGACVSACPVDVVSMRRNDGAADAG
ncbi:ferredoxin-type protein NapF [Arenibaculum sp.]|uniref:ferredoxin-type protein NapF n=1 Tax=Arenibaculum sp. TaxID=2865862 RepID=UPI002E155B32|nr:ferredoxin-type protein NapF [Arenibaculum sp.]